VLALQSYADNVNLEQYSIPND